MASANSVLRSQLNIKSVANSVNSLSKGVDRAQKSASTIGQTLVKRNRFKKDAISQDKLSFFKRREAVRRREQESIIEAGQLSGSAKRTAVPMGAAIVESTKGFLGRMMDFVGNIFVGWLLGNLPTIINTAKNLITRIQTLSGILGRFVTDIGSIIFAFGDTLGAISSNVLGFDFGREDKDVKTEFDKLNDAVSQLGTHFDEAINLLKTPLGQGPGEQETYTPPPEEQPSTPPPSGGQTVYYSQGGEKIVDIGGKDYGDYGPGRIGSRGSARVHGLGGQKGHTGEDYAMPIGTPLTMIAKGTVIDVGLGYNGGYGNFIVIQLEDGKYVKLAHLDKVFVRKGDKVGAGSGPGGTARVVGNSGNSGLSTGSHLHFDYATKYDPSSAFVSGTMDPSSFINNGGLVKGKNVKAAGQTTAQPQTPMVPSGGKTPTAPSAPAGSSGGGRWKPLLDLISSGESAGGGYSAMFPGQSYPQILNMTIAEVIQFQKEKLKDGRASAAIGRYQMLYPESYAKNAGIPLTAKFSPENQDRMAVAYLEKRRKGAEWLSGKITDAQFSEELAHEWGTFKSASGFVLPRNTGSIDFNKMKPVFQRVKGGSPQQLSPQQAQVSAQPSTSPPAAATTATSTTAQVSQPPTNATGQMQALTPERTGTNVVITPQQAAPQAAPQQQGSSGPRMTTSEISPEIVLNRFMATRLLLDLAYT